MGMDDVYHTVKFFVRGDVDLDGVIAAARSRWAATVEVGDPLRRLHLRIYPGPARDWSEALLGSASDSAMWATTDGPRDDEARACWALALGDVVDALLDSPSVEAWVLETDEAHGVGYWNRDQAVVNSTVGMEGFSMREPLALMLIDRFEARGTNCVFEDLGDFLHDD